MNPASCHCATVLQILGERITVDTDDEMIEYELIRRLSLLSCKDYPLPETEKAVRNMSPWGHLKGSIPNYTVVEEQFIPMLRFEHEGKLEELLPNRK